MMPELHVTDCPVCGALALLYHELMIEFLDTRLVAVVCPHCVSISAFVEKSPNGEWSLETCNAGQQEAILAILERDRANQEQRNRQVEQFRRYNRKPRWN